MFFPPYPRADSSDCMFPPLILRMSSISKLTSSEKIILGGQEATVPLGNQINVFVENILLFELELPQVGLGSKELVTEVELV